MAGPQRIKTNTLTDHINKSFSDFDFFQLVNVLDFLHRQENGFSFSNNSFLTAFLTKGHLNFYSQIDLNYRSSAVTNLTETVKGHNIEINLTGLIGPAGALPANYSADLIENDHNKALHDFLNIFNQRLISLYYLAWRKHRIYLQHEFDLSDDLAQLLKYITGLLPAGKKTASLNLNLQNTLLHFSGFNAKSVRSAEGLERMLQHYFFVPVSVEPFKGSWVALDSNNLSVMPSAAKPQGQFNRLSKDCVIGQRVWHSQNRFCVVIALATNEEFVKLLSNQKAIEQMKQLIKSYLGETYQFFIKILLGPEIKVRCQLSTASAPILSWNSWFETNQSMQREFILSC